MIKLNDKNNYILMYLIIYEKKNKNNKAPKYCSSM